eukprot:7841442-Karenia_brevis.AAC.1
MGNVPNYFYGNQNLGGELCAFFRNTRGCSADEPASGNLVTGNNHPPGSTEVIERRPKCDACQQSDLLQPAL